MMTNFTAGEFSPLMEGRVDIARYGNSSSVVENFIVKKTGPLSRRGGFYHAAEVKTSAKATRLIPFEFSTTQAYIIEAGDQYFRFFTNNGQLVSGTPVEVATPYLEAELFELNWTQSADVLYIAHENHEPSKLERTSATVFALSEIEFKDGPYNSINTTSTTLSPSAITGSVTITASAVDGINSDTGFQSTDVGRLIRLEISSTWYWLIITAYTDTTHVTAEVQDGKTLGGTGTYDTWRLGSFSDTSGFPSVVTFFEQRLVWAATTERPQSLFFSRTASYEDHTPTEPDGTVLDDSGFVYTIATDQVNKIRWMQAGGVLSVGTAGGEFIVSQGDSNNPLSPTNTRVVRQTTFGSSGVRAITVGPTVIFVQRAGHKLREFVYQFETDAYQAPDLTLLADHMTETGVVEMAWQQEPDSVLWAVRNDGLLLGMTYERSQEVVGWHRHPVGGTDAVVESIAVIPSPDGDRDELWAIISRTIDGATVRYVEYMTEGLPTSATDTDDATFVDSMLTYDGAATTSITGLDHLEGETVHVLTDGAVHPPQVVASGAITLNYLSATVQVGLQYKSKYRSHRPEGGMKDGTAQGKKKRISNVTYRLHKSLGLRHGPSEDRAEPIPFRSSADLMDSAPALFTGDKQAELPRQLDTDGYIYLEQDQPLPLTVVAIMPEMTTSRI
jgi:hypothetical protein